MDVDPIGRTPMAAELTLATTGPSTVELRLLGDPSSGFRTPEASRHHVVPVVGLFPDTENRIEVTLSGEEGVFLVDTLVVNTPPLPDYLPRVEVSTMDRAAMEPGWTLSTFAVREGEGWRTVPFAFDVEGRIRWYMDLGDDGNLVLPLEPLENGRLVAGTGERVFEYDWMGRHVKRLRLEGYNIHHDIVETEDGDFVVAVDKDGLSTVEDFILVVDRSSGEIEREIDLRTMLDVDRRAVGGNDEDWVHVNSVWYDDRDGGIIVSGLFQGVFKISPDDRVQWILAPHRDWGPAGVDGDGPDTASKLLTAVDASGAPYAAEVQDGAQRVEDFDWPWYQHAAMPTPVGSLLIFDNGVNRNFGSTAESYSRGVEYVIDEEARTVRQIWSYGRERGAEYQSRFISDVDYLTESGNRMVMPGATNQASAWVTEVAPSGAVAYDAQIRFNTENDGNIVYRSERVSLPR